MILSNFPQGGGSSGGITLDDVDVLICDFSTFGDVTVTEGVADDTIRQVVA